MERERDVEKYLKNKLEKMGCLFLKWVSPGNAGVPDRIVIFPNGHVWFVEVKTKAGHLSGRQTVWQHRLKEKRCSVFTVYGHDQAEEMAEAIGAILGDGR